MQILSTSECSAWLGERGIDLSATEYPLVSHSKAYEFEIAGDARQSLHLAYLFSDLERTSFRGGLLMFREWNIISPGLNRIGRQIVRRTLALPSMDDDDASTPPPVVLEACEATLVAALLLQAMIFMWDAFYVPTSGDFLIFVSHDEVAYLAAKDFLFTEDVRIQVDQLSSGVVATPYYLTRTAAVVKAS
jgi:hypothetical protein